MEKEPNQQKGAQPNPNKKSQTLNVILILLLLILAGLGVYLGVQNNKLQKQLEACGLETDDMQAERDKVVNELEGMIDQYDALQTGNDSLNEELIAERAKVEKLLSEAKNNQWTIYKLKKEASTLRDIMKGYVRTIDSLNTLNVELRAQNADVNRKLDEQKNHNEELNEINSQLTDKVRLGARLDAENMTAYAQKVRNNGLHREVTRAGKADKIKTCFTIAKNDVTEPGNKAIFIRIITPSGKVLVERNDATFEFEERNMLYSIKKVVEYENKPLDLCLYWDVETDLVEGEYLVEAYSEGFKIGNTSFTLK